MLLCCIQRCNWLQQILYRHGYDFNVNIVECVVDWSTGVTQYKKIIHLDNIVTFNMATNQYASVIVTGYNCNIVIQY